MPCPDENRLAAFAAGVLDGDDASDVKTHLSSCADCHELALALGSETLAPREATAGAGDDTARRIGRFEIIAEIGRGGMGVVFEARDPTLARHVAVKVVRGGSSGLRADARDRLLREARSLARLAHANVVPIYEAGVHEGELYIAMELIDGVPLDVWLAESRPSWRQIVGVFCAAGDGLAAAHASDLIHRDFKPGNVMVCTDGEVVKVVDFGLARPSSTAIAATEPQVEPDDADGRITVTGGFVGTPAYASPEQLRGGEATAASDLFSFCVALYEALAGSRPFSGQTRGELVTSIADARPPPLPRSVPRSVKQLVERGLHARAEERPASMAAVVTRLRGALGRRRVVAAVAVLGVVAVVASTAATLALTEDTSCARAGDQLAGVWDWPTEQAIASRILGSGSPVAPERLARVTAGFDDYAARWVAARTEACRATSVRHEQSDELLDRRIACYDSRLGELAAGVELLRAADSEDVTAAADIVAALPSLSACADTRGLLSISQPVDRRAAESVDAAIRSAETSHRAGKLQEGLSLARSAVDASTTFGHKPLIARAHLVVADLEHDAGRFEPAAAAYKKALWSAVAGQDLAREAFVAAALARVYSFAIIDRDAAKDHAQHALAALERLDDPIAVARVRGSLAIHYYHVGDLEKARAQSTAVLDLAAGDDTPSVLGLRAAAVLLKGRILSEQNHDNEGAVTLFREALRLRLKTYGPTHALVAAAREDLGEALRRTAREEEALAEFRAVAEIRETLAGEANEYSRLMFAAMASEDPAQSAELTARAAAVAESLFGAEHPNVAAALDARAEALSESEDFAAAVLAAQRAVEISEKFEPGGSSTLGTHLITLASALGGSGRVNEAVEAAVRAEVAFNGDANASSMSRMLAKIALADIYITAKDWEKGCPIVREVPGMPGASDFARLAPEAPSLFALTIAVCDWELGNGRTAALAAAEKHFALVRDVLAEEEPAELAELSEWFEKARRETR